MNRNRAAFLAGIALLAWGLKRYYADADVDALAWILAPAAKLSAVLSGSHFEWEPGAGYLAREQFFLIAKPCAGLNFMIAALGMIGFLVSERARSLRDGVVLTIVSCVSAYVVTIAANTVRIVLALWLAAHPIATGWWTAARIHRLEGIVVYFGVLVLLHAGVQHLIARKAIAQEGAGR